MFCYERARAALCHDVASFIELIIQMLTNDPVHRQTDLTLEIRYSHVISNDLFRWTSASGVLFAFCFRREKEKWLSVKFVTQASGERRARNRSNRSCLGVLSRVFQQLALYCNNRAICGKQHRHQRDKIHQRRLTRKSSYLTKRSEISVGEHFTLRKTNQQNAAEKQRIVIGIHRYGWRSQCHTIVNSTRWILTLISIVY